MKTRSMTRFWRQHWINHRVRIIRTQWGDDARNSPWAQKTGRFSKFNLKCTCGLCKQERYSRAQEKVYTRQMLNED